MLVLTLTGLLIGGCLAGMGFLQDLLQHIPSFLSLYGAACLGYGIAVYWLLRRPGRLQNTSDRRVLPLIIGLAIVFRATLLFTTPPTLSDDVYRYIWDGRLANAGVNPYAHAVESPLLDRFESPQRSLVNHSWMASPYLPVTQALFAAVYWLIPDSPLAFQVVAILLDLLTGGMIIGLLRRFDLPRERCLIYLWNPLVIVEFAHSAHADVLMICLITAVFWSLATARRKLFSVVALAAATLTKGIPVLILPVVAPWWGWRYTFAYLALTVVACVPFAVGAGWGLTGPLDGEGLFGALRIYSTKWNYNSGLYHWLETTLSGYHTTGAVPIEAVGPVPIVAAKLVVTVALGLACIAVWRASRQCRSPLSLIRLAVVPPGAYLLLTTTVHPWYVTLLLPLLPFLPAQPGQRTRGGRFIWPWLYFSATVVLSYLTYLDPANLREYALVRLVEYVPLYLLLCWAAWPTCAGADCAGTSHSGPRTQSHQRT